jgi:HK97 family phage prohead protease
MADTYRPTKAIQNEAKKALAWIADGKAGDGFTDTGRKRASDLAAGHPLSAQTVLRMYSFLKRHQVDSNATGFNSGEEGFPSPGRVAWSAWGGDPGLNWSSKIRDQLAERSAFMKEENSMDTNESPSLYGENAYGIANSVMAVDASIDAAQTLLEQIKDTDSIAAQAYYLLVAADNALDPVIDALGLTDPDEPEDDDTAETTEATDATNWTAPDLMPRSEEITPENQGQEESSMIEERKTIINSAEKITMSAEVRAVDTEDGSLKIAGYAATFGNEATGLNFREVIAPGAFTRALANDNPVFLLVNHDMDGIPLASTQSGTMRLAQDKVGLRMEADLDPANPRAQELASALRRGDITKMSFAFTVGPDGQTREDGLRTLTEIDHLYEVSAVTLPAYDDTVIGLRKSGEEDLELAKRKLALKFNQRSLRQKRKA